MYTTVYKRDPSKFCKNLRGYKKYVAMLGTFANMDLGIVFQFKLTPGSEEKMCADFLVDSAVQVIFKKHSRGPTPKSPEANERIKSKARMAKQEYGFSIDQSALHTLDDFLIEEFDKLKSKMKSHGYIFFSQQVGMKSKIDSPKCSFLVDYPSQEQEERTIEADGGRNGTGNSSTKSPGALSPDERANSFDPVMPWPVLNVPFSMSSGKRKRNGEHSESSSYDDEDNYSDFDELDHTYGNGPQGKEDPNSAYKENGLKKRLHDFFSERFGNYDCEAEKSFVHQIKQYSNLFTEDVQFGFALAWVLFAKDTQKRVSYTVMCESGSKSLARTYFPKMQMYSKLPFGITAERDSFATEITSFLPFCNQLRGYTDNTQFRFLDSFDEQPITVCSEKLYPEIFLRGYSHRGTPIVDVLLKEDIFKEQFLAKKRTQKGAFAAAQERYQSLFEIARDGCRYSNANCSYGLRGEIDFMTDLKILDHDSEMEESIRTIWSNALQMLLIMLTDKIPLLVVVETSKMHAYIATHVRYLSSYALHIVGNKNYQDIDDMNTEGPNCQKPNRRPEPNSQDLNGQEKGKRCTLKASDRAFLSSEALDFLSLLEILLFLLFKGTVKDHHLRYLKPDAILKEFDIAKGFEKRNRLVISFNIWDFDYGSFVPKTYFAAMAVNSSFFRLSSVTDTADFSGLSASQKITNKLEKEILAVAHKRLSFIHDRQSVPCWSPQFLDRLDEEDVEYELKEYQTSRTFYYFLRQMVHETTYKKFRFSIKGRSRGFRQMKNTPWVAFYTIVRTAVDQSVEKNKEKLFSNITLELIDAWARDFEKEAFDRGDNTIIWRQCTKTDGYTEEFVKYDIRPEILQEMTNLRNSKIRFYLDSVMGCESFKDIPEKIAKVVKARFLFLWKHANTEMGFMNFLPKTLFTEYQKGDTRVRGLEHNGKSGIEVCTLYPFFRPVKGVEKQFQNLYEEALGHYRAFQESQRVPNRQVLKGYMNCRVCFAEFFVASETSLEFFMRTLYERYCYRNAWARESRYQLRPVSHGCDAMDFRNSPMFIRLPPQLQCRAESLRNLYDCNQGINYKAISVVLLHLALVEFAVQPMFLIFCSSELQEFLQADHDIEDDAVFQHLMEIKDVLGIVSLAVAGLLLHR
eukprot:Nk52_evm3s256 gene=Nk52_evmTU3s256